MSLRLRILQIFNKNKKQKHKRPNYRTHSTFQHFREQLHKIYISIGLILSTASVGMVGFALIENYTWIEAFYMTIITLSTVGYGEVQPLSDAGRMFAAFIIIFNIGIFTYAISVISSFIVEGDFRQMLKYYRMQGKIDDLEQHIIVCGFGRYGAEVARNLQLQDTPFVIVEKVQEDEKDYQQYGYLFVMGDATNDQILEQAGLERAAGLICCLPDDTDNVYVVLTARQFNPNIRIVSRAINQRSEAKLLRAGANEVITPERIGGFFMANLMGKPDLVEFFNSVSQQEENGVYLEEIDFETVPSHFCNRSIADLNIGSLTGTNVIAIRNDNGQYIINPPANTIIQPHTHLIVLGNKDQIQRFKQMWQQK